MLKRSIGCLLGQLCGDALGSMVEFKSAETIKKRFPEGISDIEGSEVWSTLPGQPTDDSEMALALARTIIANGGYQADKAREAYVDWLSSRPFDIGNTVYSGLTGKPNLSSQANGAMMRVSPLGIYGAGYPLDQVARWAEQDARITHPNQVCVDANILYAKAISEAIAKDKSADELYESVVRWAVDGPICEEVKHTVLDSCIGQVSDYKTNAGWVLVALRNALWHLSHSTPFEKAVIETVSQGGDADTNGAICGALLGAVYGAEAVPDQWKKTVLSCRPRAGEPVVMRPRPERFWPTDALDIAEKLVGMK